MVLRVAIHAPIIILTLGTTHTIPMGEIVSIFTSVTTGFF